MKIKEILSNKLAKKLMWWLSLILVIIVAYVILISTKKINEISEKYQADMSEMAIKAFQIEIDDAIDEMIRASDVLGKRLINHNHKQLNKSLVEADVQEILSLFEVYKGVAIVLDTDYYQLNHYWYREGDFIMNEPLEETDTYYYLYALNGKDYTIIEPQSYTVGSDDICLTTIITPIKDGNKIIGYICIDLSTGFFKELTENLKLMDGLQYAVVASNGVLVSTDDEQAIGEVVLDTRLSNHTPGEISFFDDEIADYIAPFTVGQEHIPWYLVFELSSSYFNDTLLTMNLNIIVSGILAIILIVIMNGITIQKVLSPIVEITDVMNLAAQGDLSGRVSIKSSDEIESIGEGLNNLLTSLAANRKELENEIHLNRQLNEDLAASINENQRTYYETIISLVRTIETKDAYTAGHCDRVTEISMAMGKEIHLNQEELLQLRYGASLHDVGKVGIPGQILNKAGRLTDEEYDIIRKHPLKGYKIIKDVHFLDEACKVVLHHHERYDGQGYPYGLAGSEINRSAMIVAIADTYDAMTSSRSYRKALDKKIAFEEIVNNSGTQFDPELVEVFKVVYRRNNNL